MSSTQTSNPKTQSFPQPLDWAAIALMLALGLLIGLLLWNGDRTAPRVRDFNWQDKQVGAEDTAFVLNFNRPMNQTSVEESLRITPPLPGKISWAGRRMAYTLTTPAPYGTAYEVRLQGAKDRFADEVSQHATLQPFLGRFRTRDRAFVYIGIEGDEEGRLILYNLTQQQKQVLTPKNLVVMDFKSYEENRFIVFSAVERSPTQKGLLDQHLYTVTTGIYNQSPSDPLAQSPNWFMGKATPQAGSAEPAGKINQILDSRDYQNLKFELSANGQMIVVQRVNRRQPADFGPWLVKLDATGAVREAPIPLGNQPGGDFLITPDSSSLAIAQGEGLAILPLHPQAEPLDFLPKFGTVLSFAKDGSQAAMIKFNKDYTRSLFLVTNQGVQKELLRITGSILNAQFDPQKQNLYCLLTRLIPGESYQEQPYIAIVDLKTAKVVPWLALPIQQGIQMSLAPDGLALLLDQPIAGNTAQKQGGRNIEGKSIATSRLWLLPIVSNKPEVQVKVQPENLPLAGFYPRWLP